MASPSDRRSRLILLVLILWALQGLWLARRYAPDLPDLMARIGTGRLGQAVRAETPFYNWLREVEKALPPESAYIFLDLYETGRYIEARYHLYPRRQVLLRPEIPASFLYYAVRQYQATFLVVPEGDKPPGPGLKALTHTPACRLLPLPGPGRIYQVNPADLLGFFYD